MCICGKRETVNQTADEKKMAGATFSIRVSSATEDTTSNKRFVLDHLQYSLFKTYWKK